jgi:protocatechuate 3,4-dioxygenase beta subunit
MAEICTIRGRVESESGEPLRKAEVTATNFEQQLIYLAVTDADGVFDLEDVEPGRYRVEARRNGYVPAVYGERDEFVPVTPLTVAPERETGEIVFCLAPQAVLTGRVLDEDSDPLEGVYINLLRETDFGHGKQLAPRSGSPTMSDDQGSFRIAGIAAGTWFLSATFGRVMRRRLGTVRQGAEEAYPTLYYPDTLDESEAQPIRIAAGTELSGFELRMRKTGAYHVRGRVEVPPDADRHSVWIRLDPRLRGSWILAGGGVADSHGSDLFDLGGILPGSYTLRASCNEGCIARQTELEIEVIDRDLEGLVLRFPEGAEVRGILRGVDEPGGIHITLANRETRMQSAGAITARDGTFTLAPVSPGNYRLHTWHGPAGAYLKSVRYGALETPAGAIEMPDPAGGGVLEILLATDSATISGTVVNPDGNPLPGAAARLWSGNDGDEPGQFAIADQDGRFEIQAIAPGVYRVAASPSTRQLSGPESGESLTLAAGEKRAIILRPNAIQ